MTRKMALEHTVWTVRKGREGKGRRGGGGIKHLPPCQKIIIVPSWGSVTDSDNDVPFKKTEEKKKRGLFLQSAQLII